MAPLPSHASDNRSNTHTPERTKPRDVPIVFLPDVPSHTGEIVSMLQADIESTRTKRHHA